MPSATASPEDRLLPLLDRLRRLDADAPLLTGAQLSTAQLSLLSAVAAAPGCGVQDIAVALGLAAPTVSVAVSRLESIGLLERHPNLHDRRAIHLELTTRGEAIFRKALAARRRRAADLLSGLPPEDRSRLVDLLERTLGAAAAPGRPRSLAALLQRLRGFWSGSTRP